MLSSVSVIGLGKLGAPMAACFAARGFQVIAVDLDAQKVDAIGRGVPPVHEPGLAELLQEGKGHLSATQDTEAAVRDSQATFIVVGTPSEPDGGFSLRYAIPTCEAVGRALRDKNSFHLVVLTSTVMPGSTGGEIKSVLERASGKRCGEDFGLCYSPEFIALGTVIRDFYYPDFLLIGESDRRTGDILSEIYSRTCKNSPAIARMNFINAEVTKLAVNTYITTKISYANMLARLCEKLPEADVSVVTNALGLDSRIGSKYLKGGVSYGGPCFPRDNRAFAALAERNGAFSDLAVATDRFNRVRIAASAEDCIAQSAIVVLATPWQEFRDLSISAWVQPFRSGPSFHATQRVVIDCWRALPHLEGSQSVHYVRLGAPSRAAQPVAASTSAD